MNIPVHCLNCLRRIPTNAEPCKYCGAKPDRGPTLDVLLKKLEKVMDPGTNKEHPNVLPTPQPKPGTSSETGYTASVRSESGIGLLADRLNGQPPGYLHDESGEITNLLTLAWDELANGRQTKMDATKVWRIEKLHWMAPVLSFEIERHGAAAFGSSRAEIQRWTVNLDTRQASCESVGRRQLRPAAKPLKTQPLVEKIAKLILKHRKDDRLKWISPAKVRVEIGLVIEETNPQTTQGRRRRFRSDLEKELQKAGWKPAKGSAPNTYEKIDSQDAYKPAQTEGGMRLPIRE